MAVSEITKNKNYSPCKSSLLSVDTLFSVYKKKKKRWRNLVIHNSCMPNEGTQTNDDVISRTLGISTVKILLPSKESKASTYKCTTNVFQAATLLQTQCYNCWKHCCQKPVQSNLILIVCTAIQLRSSIISCWLFTDYKLLRYTDLPLNPSQSNKLSTSTRHRTNWVPFLDQYFCTFSMKI